MAHGALGNDVLSPRRVFRVAIQAGYRSLVLAAVAGYCCRGILMTLDASDLAIHAFIMGHLDDVLVTAHAITFAMDAFMKFVGVYMQRAFITAFGLS